MCPSSGGDAAVNGHLVSVDVPATAPATCGIVSGDCRGAGTGLRVAACVQIAYIAYRARRVREGVNHFLNALHGHSIGVILWIAYLADIAAVPVMDVAPGLALYGLRIAADFIAVFLVMGAQALVSLPASAARAGSGNRFTSTATVRRQANRLFLIVTTSKKFRNSRPPEGILPRRIPCGAREFPLANVLPPTPWRAQAYHLSSIILMKYKNFSRADTKLAKNMTKITIRNP